MIQSFDKNEGENAKTVKMAGDSDEILTGYFTNTNIEYSVYVILIQVLKETRQENRTKTKWPKLCDAKCTCVVSHLWKFQRETVEYKNYISNNIITNARAEFVQKQTLSNKYLTPSNLTD